MKTYPLLCCVILMGISCSLFQHTTKKQSEKRYKSSSKLMMNTAARTKTVKHTEQSHTHKDTVFNDYDVRFWPKGSLSFLPSGGFSGEFDSVQLKGKLKVLSNSSALVLKDEEQNEIKRKNLQTAQNEKSSSKDVSKTSSMDVKLLVFIAFVICAGLFFWFKKKI